MRQSERTLRRMLWGVLILVLVGVVSAGARSVFHQGPASAAAGRLPIYGTVPDFSLIERGGRSLARVDLAGKIWIADFIFTRCPGICPALTSRMAYLQAALGNHGNEPITLVSFSVDPERDTPETLRRYADRYGADVVQWLFVTGEREAMHRLIREGFRLSVADLPPAERGAASEPIVHSDRFVLVDRNLQIRGYYHGTEEESVKRLLRDVETLRHG